MITAICLGCAIVFIAFVFAGFIRETDLAISIAAGIVGGMALSFVCLLSRSYGMTNVPDSAETFDRRLSDGIVYRVMNFTQVSDGLVLLVQDTGSKGVQAIHVPDHYPPPLKFTLIDGRPVGIK